MSTRRLAFGTVFVLAVVVALAMPAVARAQGITRYVNPSDPTCGGHAPCYTTIQAAVTAALAADTIQLQAGTYHEQVSITGKNSTSTSESDRIVIQADPAAAVGSVVLQGAITQCTNGYGVKFQQSKFITLRGLTITGAGGQAVSMLGGNNQNQAIHLERLRIFGNGSSECNGGITINSGNPDTLVLNSLIYGNGRNGFTTLDSTGGPHYVIGNTIHGNAWSGVNVSRSHVTWLVNNAITSNGTAAGSTGGRYGVVRESSTSPDPVGIHLLNNLICGNRLGEINGPALDGTDAANLTPTGSEGPGVSASPGCDVAANVYTHVVGADGVANTADDDFTLATGSPDVDSGMDPRTLGLSTAFNPLLTVDFAGAPRPMNATGATTALFDRGALEKAVPDTTPPTVSFVQPAANAYVRQTVTVQAQATDSGSGVASLVLTLDGQAFSTTLAPTLPPPAPSVTATTTWTTTTVADGAHNFVATAADAAGNHASAPLVVLVDNTPPDTQIVTGPSGEILVGSATFTFSGSDNLTPVGSLVYAYQLDGGAWSAFAPTTTVSFPALTETGHTFAVKARDLAGNEDPTPATRTFSVSFKPGITTVSPSSGPIGTYVTITGINFEPGTTTVSVNGLAAVIRTITPTQVTTTVPVGAATGPLIVTNSRGSASVSFTVTLTGDFQLTAAPASPASVSVIAGDQGAAWIAASGSGSFAGLVSLSVSSGPSGITAGFSPQLVAPGSSSFLAFTVANTVPPGTYSFTVTGQADVDGRSQTRSASVSLQVLAANTLAVTGRVLTAEAVPKPIPGVQVTLQSAFAPTDAAGNFVLQGSPAHPLTPGPAMLRVDGSTASGPTVQYPLVEVQINVASSGPSRVPFILYLPALDTAHPITLPLKTDGSGETAQEVQATTPLIPGLVVTIPVNTKITGPDGLPVRQITITPVPVDRSPMPFPPGVTIPMLFSIQPGNSVPSQPLPISFPNVQQAPPGAVADLYFFDLAVGGWATWGTGTVSADGSQIVSDPGFGLPRFAWHGTAQRVSLSDQVRSRQANRATGGEPVDLPTGRFTVQKTDLVLPARVPLTIQRFYRSENPVVGILGRGWALDPYETTLLGQGTSMVLTYPDQSSAVFAPAGAGQWRNTTEPALLGAVLTQLPGDFIFQIRFKDGTVQRFDRILGFANLAGLAAITDRNGNTVTLTREGVFQQNRITQITEPAGRLLTLAYDTAGRVSTITDPIGRVVQYFYDPQGRLSTVIDPAGGQTSYTYDASNRILTITDPRNITFLTNTYDTNGRVSQQTQADGGVWQFSYGLDGTLVTQTTVTDSRGNATTYRFDARGNTLSQTDALGQTTSYGYANGSNLLLSTTDPLGRTTLFTYDAHGNVATTTDPAGVQRSFTYDPTFNQVTSMTNPITPPTQFAYDALGNLSTVTDPRGKNTTLTYNTAGQPLTITDPLGHVTTVTYDGVGNLATTADPLGNTMRFDYDAVSRLTRRTDPGGRATTFAYDPLNHLKTLTDALGGLTNFTYDGNGNLLNVTDARPNPPTTYTYDAMDRVATRIDPLGASESFAYDPAGNLTQRTDRKGQVSTFAYDALNRLTTSSYADGSGTTNRYDAAGRLVRVDDSIGGTLTNTYDLLDRLLAQSTTLGSVSYAYDAIGRRTQLTTPGVAPTTYGYDANSRLTQIIRDTQTATVAYDDAGRRTLLTLPNGVSTQYQYDDASRLTALIYASAAGNLGNLTYQYDPAGNRSRIGGSFARTLLRTAIPSASYDPANRQLAFGSSQMTFDPNGNLTTFTDPSGTTAFTWDARDRLIGLEQSGTVASFTYAFGRRAAKTVNGAATQFLYDGLDLVQQFDAQRATSYLRSLSIDETLGLTNPDGTFFLTADGLGSTLAVTDISSNTVTAYTYDAFGAVSATSPASPNPFQFTGRENDGLAGLYYYRARYYHPGLQRFISEDPLGFAGGDPNLYAYVGNNPISFRDPTGNIAIAAPVVIGGVAIVALWLASPQGQQAVRDAVEGAQQFAETAIESLQSLMGRRQRETGLENISDEEISRRARDKSIPWEERRRYIAEDKYRKKRNINKERGGPNKFSGLNLFELAPPLELTAPDPINLSGRKDR